MATTMKTSSRQEQQWQAEDDARTMARYQEIIGDKARMGRAVKVAQQQMSDLKERMDAMNKVASTKVQAGTRAKNGAGASRTSKKR